MRLIDADAIEYTYTTIRSNEDGHNWRVFAIGQDEIDATPTIDAVPVVRCRECAFWGLEPKEGRAEAMCLDLMRTTASGFYCAHGQRREDDNA